ncbi:hypothetical protein HAX54_040433, partial [Datura stramonium]|nr:hypothetical protein [Datura stramonium]
PTDSGEEWQAPRPRKKSRRLLQSRLPCHLPSLTKWGLKPHREMISRVVDQPKVAPHPFSHRRGPKYTMRAT